MNKQEKISIKSEKKDKTVEEYIFEPIKGHPYLHWRGKRPFKSTQYFPAQLKERYGNSISNWMNEIYWGDNLQVMSHLLKKYRGKINLIYIDPPFDSKAEYKKKISLRGKVVTNDNSSFEEKQYIDLWSNDEYLQFIYERIILSRALLSKTGSIYLHCDWHKSHYLRCIIEEIFGIGGKDSDKTGFRNEVIWCYSDAANSKKYWNTKHDTIIYATKGSKWTFNYKQVLRPLKESSIKKYRYTDKIGKYRLFGKNIEGSPIRWHRDVPEEWEKTNPELVYRHYLKDGSLPLDWWNINPVNQVARERTNYPTQKPEELLERIILASSNPGDIVFDCFMGSGTTQAVAMKLGRKFIGADINLGAIQTTTDRLIKIAEELNQNAQTKIQTPEDENKDIFYTGFKVFNVNNYDLFRNPVEAKELLIEALEIQPIARSTMYDGEKDGRMVKIMPINRIATKADLGELITGFDYKAFERRKSGNPNKPVENILIVCMGHEPDLSASLQKNVGYLLDIMVVDILRDRTKLEFKRDSEAKINIKDKCLVIESFYPMNLLQKLSIMKEDVSDWRELVDSIMIDWDYDGKVMKPNVIDLPEKNEIVKGKYNLPEDVGKIRVKITDLLSESFEVEVIHA